MITVKNLTKKFDDFTALDNISFEVEEGAICGFVGPNGAGKTTTMRIMATLELPSYGNVAVNGFDVVNAPMDVRHSLGYMPDYYGVYPSMIVSEYLDFFARAYGLSPNKRKERIHDVSYFTELKPLLTRPVEGLSKGQKQRLGLARSLLPDPQVLILDEPAAGLDPRARIELRELIKLLAENGKTIFVSSHILSELADFIHQIIVIDRGSVRYSGSLSELQKSHQGSCFVFEFTSDLGDARRFLLEQPGIVDVRGETEQMQIYFDEEHEQASQIDQLIVTMIERGLRFRQCFHKQDRLEDVFLAITEEEGNE